MLNPISFLGFSLFDLIVVQKCTIMYYDNFYIVVIKLYIQNIIYYYIEVYIMDVMILAIVFVIYIFALVFVSYYAYRKTNSSEDFMIAGKDTHPFIMAMSYGATFVSTAAIVGFGGVAGEYGMSVLWLAFLNIIIGVFIAFVFLGKRTRRMGHALGSLTFPEFLGKRFDSRFIHYVSGLIIFCAMPLSFNLINNYHILRIIRRNPWSNVYRCFARNHYGHSNDIFTCICLLAARWCKYCKHSTF